MKKKRLIIGFLIALLFSGLLLLKQNNFFKHYDELTVHYLNTGNSDCSIIEYGDKFIVIDGGDLDDKVFVVKYLQKLGAQSIYVLEMSHPDADHVGALSKIIEDYDVTYTFISNGEGNSDGYRAFVEALANQGVSPSIPLDGSILAIDEDTYLQFFNTKEIHEDSNDNSIITLLVHGQDRFVFTGDASTSNQAIYAKELKDIDVLKVAHHGSYKNNTRALFLNYNPEIAVITCGKGNDYGHPHKEVIQTLNDLKIKTLRTDELKTIKILSSGKGVKYVEGE